MTAPLRCGAFASMIFAERSRPAGPVRSTKSMETESLSRAEGSMFASAASNPRSGRDIDAEHGSGRGDLEGVDTVRAIASCRLDNCFLNCRISAMLSPGRSRRRSRRAKPVPTAQKFGAKRNFPFAPCKPWISPKTAKGIFGNVWRKGPQIWKCLARGWKSLEPPKSGKRETASSRSDRPLHPAAASPPASALAIRARVASIP
jgi:hypothetical protein